MIFKVLFFFFCLTFINVNAKGLKDIVFEDVVVQEVTSVHDGDTFRANIKGYPKLVGYRMSIRVLGIDTPEMNGKCISEKELARAAKKFTVSFLRAAKVIELRNIKRGKYFRILAVVYGDNTSLADALIKNGLAVMYDGGTRVDWCE